MSANTITVQFASQVTTTVQLNGDNIGSTNNPYLVNGGDQSATYTASTTVPVTKYATKIAAMTAGM